MRHARKPGYRVGILSIVGRLGTVALFAVAPSLAAAQDALPSTDEPVLSTTDKGGMTNSLPEGGGGGPGCGEGPAEPAPVEPEKFARSPGDVDMRTGQFLYSHVDLSLGDANGLSLDRRFVASFNGGISRFAGFSHNWEIFVSEKRVRVCSANTPQEYDYVVSVTAGPRSKTFRAVFNPQDDEFAQIDTGDPGFLEFDYIVTVGIRKPTNYRYYASDGTKVLFRPIGPASSADDNCHSPQKCAYASEITEPDGTKYNFSYDIVSTPSDAVRLRSVVSSRGYAMLFEYTPIGPNNFWAITKACVLNLSQVNLPSTAGEQICPAGVPTSSYTYASGKMSSFTDQSLVPTLIGPDATVLYFPGASTPYLTNTMEADLGAGPHVTSQVFADGRRYDYSWDYDQNMPIRGIAGGSYTNRVGDVVSVAYDKRQSSSVPTDPTWKISSQPMLIVDELGRLTSYKFCGNAVGKCDLQPTISMTDADGVSQYYTYGGYRMITRMETYPKPGSALDTLVITRDFGCTVPVCRTKPTVVTDAGGNTTTYAYSLVHGGLLSEVGPVVGGVSPAKKYSYVQRSAWIKGSGSGYVSTGMPVWLLGEERGCRTTALNLTSGACGGGVSDLVVTAYDYGPDSGPNNLWLRGMTVTAGGQTLRSCYGYDAQGNKISETSPRAGLSGCT